MVLLYSFGGNPKGIAKNGEEFLTASSLIWRTLEIKAFTQGESWFFEDDYGSGLEYLIFDPYPIPAFQM